MSDGVGYVGHVGMSDMSGMSDLSPGIEVSRPIEATSRPHRGQHRDSVDAQHRGWQKPSRLSLGVTASRHRGSIEAGIEARIEASTRASIEATSSYIEATWRLVG